MMFVYGPLWSGKRAAAKELLGWDEAMLRERAVLDAQELARGDVDPGDLARELSRYELVIAAEVGGGVVPADAAERAWRERAGRLNCLLAERAEVVVRVLCGIPKVMKGELP